MLCPETVAVCSTSHIEIVEIGGLIQPRFLYLDNF